MKKISLAFILLSLLSLQLFGQSYEKFLDLIKGKTDLEQTIWLERQIKKDKDIRYYVLKARIELKLADYIGAKKTLLAAQKISDSAEVRDLLGLAYYNLKDYDNAKKAFASVLTEKPDDSMAYMFLTLMSPLAVLDIDGADAQTANELSVLDSVNLDELAALYAEELEPNCTADFVYLLNERYVSVIDITRYDYIARFVIKVRTQAAVGIFRDFTFSYNGYEYSAKVLRAGTYTENGDFIAVNSKHIVDTDNQKNASSMMYSNRKTLAFPFPDVSVGSVVEVAIKFSSTGKTLTPKLYDCFTLWSDIPALSCRYTVSCPENVNIGISEVGSGIVSSQIRQNGKFINKYVYNPGNDTSRDKKIVISGYESWEEVAQWYDQLFFSTIAAEDDKTANDILTQLNISGKSKMEQISEIYHYIRKHIRYVGMELAENAMNPHKPSEIYKNKFGDCKDRVVLTAYLLDKLGIKSEIALLSTGNGEQPDENIPSPLYFNHVISYIPVQDGVDQELFLDTTASKIGIDNLPASDQDLTTLIVGSGASHRFGKTPLIEPKKNNITETFVSNVSVTGAGTISYSEKFSGAYSDMIYENLEGKSYDAIVQAMFKTHSDSYQNLSKDDVSVSGLDAADDDIRVSLTANEKNIVSLFFDGKMKIKFSLTEVLGILGLPNDPNRDYRRSFLSSYNRHVEYVMPRNYAITDGTVKNVYKQNEYVSLEFSADKSDNNTYIFDVECQTKKRLIPKDAVPATMKLVAEFIALTNFELTFENRIDFDNETFFDALLDEYDYREVYEKYIQYLNSLHKYEKSLTVCDRAMEKFNTDSSFALIKASILFELERYDEEEIHLKDLLNWAMQNNKKEDITNVYYYLISLYKRTNDNAKFEQILGEALDEYPNDRALLGEATSFYCRNEMYDKAIAVLERAINGEHSNSSLYTDLGYVYSMIPEFDKAQSAFRNALKYDKNNHNAMNNLAWLYCEHNTQLDEARTLAERATELEPLNDAYLDTLGEVYYRLGEYENAKTVFMRAYKINPNSYLQHQLDKIEAALKAIRDNDNEGNE
ncbi:MAG: DUF3857 domain-containing protein [Spirochaetales bacterium]|nr:DUF3857 domain-containing protein [Spirochaetales bacterium]